MSIKKDGRFQFEKRLCPLSAFDSMNKLEIPRLMLSRKGIQQEIVLLSIADILADLFVKRKDVEVGITEWRDIFTSKQFWRLVYCRSFHLLQVALGKSVSVDEGPSQRPKGWQSDRFKLVVGEPLNLAPGVEAERLRDEYLNSPKYSSYATDYLKKLNDSKYIGQKGYLAVFLLKLYESLPLSEHKYEEIVPQYAFEAALAVLSQKDEIDREHWCYFIELPPQLVSVYENSKPYITEDEYLAQEAKISTIFNGFKIFGKTLQATENLLVNKGAVGSYRNSKYGCDTVSLRTENKSFEGDAEITVSQDVRPKRKRKALKSVALKSSIHDDDNDAGKVCIVDEMYPLAPFQHEVDKTASIISSICEDKKKLMQEKEVFDDQVKKKLATLNYKIQTETQRYERAQGTLDLSCIKLNIGDRITDLLMEFSSDAVDPESHLVPVLQNFEQLISSQQGVRDFFIEMAKAAWKIYRNDTESHDIVIGPSNTTSISQAASIQTCVSSLDAEHNLNKVSAHSKKTKITFLSSPTVNRKANKPHIAETCLTEVPIIETKSHMSCSLNNADMTSDVEIVDLTDNTKATAGTSYKRKKNCMAPIVHDVANDPNDFSSLISVKSNKKGKKVKQNKMETETRAVTKDYYKTLREMDTGKTELPPPSQTSLGSFGVTSNKKNDIADTGTLEIADPSKSREPVSASNTSYEDRIKKQPDRDTFGTNTGALLSTHTQSLELEVPSARMCEGLQIGECEIIGFGSEYDFVKGCPSRILETSNLNTLNPDVNCVKELNVALREALDCENLASIESEKSDDEVDLNFL